jgi:formylglycine-generating enzyme required for sulfatase activity/dienelactone hydrolase
MSDSTKAIFLSYASQDTDAARRICAALRAAGLEVWFDQSELRGGDAWDTSIRRQIKECTLFVPIISANTNARAEGYFRLEWKLAIDRSHLIADDQPFLLPVILEEVPEANARVPERFRERQWSRVNSDESVGAFAQRVRGLLGGTDVAATPAPAQHALPIQSSVSQATAPANPVPKVESALLTQAKPVTPVAPVLVAKQSRAANSRRLWLFTGIGLAVVIMGAGLWTVMERNRKAVFIADALPRIEAMADRQQFAGAFQLARDVEKAGGGDLLTPARRDSFSREVSLQSDPVGAAVSYRLHGMEAWQEAGTTPVASLRVPRGFIQWRATLAGHNQANRLLFPQPAQKIEFTLIAENSPDASMVPVVGGQVRLRNVDGLKTAEVVAVPPFLIDRTEVSNRNFARFVLAGGYAKPEYWKHAFRDGDKILSFDAAMQRFRDATGRSGPANWKLGSPPPGEEEMPVRGISWYEASAYATFAGKELPGLYHWFWADNANDMVGYQPSVILPLSNFESTGPRKVGEGGAVSAFGATNMAGNVREWIANTNDKGKYLALGGAWAEPSYSYLRPEPHSAFDRPLDTGVRCMKRIGTEPIPDVALNTIPTLPAKSAISVKPVGDAEFAIYKRLYDRKRAPLDAKVEATDTTPTHWTRQKVSYAAGYNGERMWAYLYLPRSAKPPYQTIVHLGGSGIFTKRPFVSDADYPGFQIVDVLVRGGRAVIVPIWNGSFERHGKFDDDDDAQFKEYNGLWVTELRQTVDLIQSREDLDKEKIGFQGASFGAERAPLLLALEPRIKTGLLLLGGIDLVDNFPAEINPVNFAPRVTASILMLNGKGDPIFPYETSQVVLYKLLGAPAAQKRHMAYASGHGLYGWYDEMVREQLDWLDKVFGPVTPAGGK